MKTQKKPIPLPTFADALTRNMAMVGYTDETLSERIGYAADTIYRWRTGKNIPPQRTRNVVLQALTEKRNKQKP